MTEATGIFAGAFRAAGRMDWTRDQNALWLPTADSYTLPTCSGFRAAATTPPPRRTV